uniref:Uncharacterized protein n=1 Tax=Oryza sativa subsp. japonica TaxID=39947 RepID=Q6Z783_ORYSJ|nr:hypothetical protein [Oryza sativa Japonica Group]BAD15862.1 hypothetical protein [Oryza sativa Japonica Group]
MEWNGRRESKHWQFGVGQRKKEHELQRAREVLGFLAVFMESGAVKEIDLLKEAYPEETEFKENAEGFFLIRQGFLYPWVYVHPGSMDKSNVPPVQAIVSSTSASFKAASVHSTSRITLGFYRYRLNHLARLD